MVELNVVKFLSLKEAYNPAISGLAWHRVLSFGLGKALWESGVQTRNMAMWTNRRGKALILGNADTCNACAKFWGVGTIPRITSSAVLPGAAIPVWGVASSVLASWALGI